MLPEKKRELRDKYIYVQIDINGLLYGSTFNR